MKSSVRAMLGCLILSSCAGAELTSHVRPMAPIGRQASCEAGANGVIECDKQTYATVLCSPPRSKACRALGVKYQGDGDTTWLFCAAGYDVSAPEKYQRPSYVDVQFASNVILSTDGAWVWFMTRSLSGTDSWHAYSVERGTMKGVEHSDVWKIWAALREGRALWLGMERPSYDVIRWW